MNKKTVNDLYSDKNIFIKSINISENYIPNFGIIESIRELFQNLRDQCKEISIFKNELLIEYNNPDFEVQNSISFVKSFEFKTKQDQKTCLGFVKYDYKSQTAVFENFGAIDEIYIVSLGETNKRNSNDLIGKHGEGLKLAALCCKRNSIREIFIYTEGKKYSYSLEYEYEYSKSKILFVIKEDLENKDDYKGKTSIVIRNLSIEDWVKSCNKILHFCSKEEKPSFLFP